MTTRFDDTRTDVTDYQRAEQGMLNRSKNAWRTHAPGSIYKDDSGRIVEASAAPAPSRTRSDEKDKIRAHQDAMVERNRNAWRRTTGLTKA